MELIPFFGGMDPFGASFPKIDVHETNKEVIVMADIPGVDPKKVEVQVGENEIRISGHVEEEKETKSKNFYRKERISRSFNRMVSLPCPVKEAGVKAVSKNGILTVTLLKKFPQELKMKKVPVEEQ